MPCPPFQPRPRSAWAVDAVLPDETITPPCRLLDSARLTGLDLGTQLLPKLGAALPRAPLCASSQPAWAVGHTVCVSGNYGEWIMIRGHQMASAAGAIALASVAFAAPASAANAPAISRGAITVTTPASGPFTLSNDAHRAGQVRFHFISHAPQTMNGGGSDVVLIGLRNGVSLTTVENHIRAQQGPPAGAAASTRWLKANVHVYGGAAIHGKGTADVSAFLPAGTVYLVDTNSIFGGPQVNAKAFHVFGSAARSLLPPIAGTIDVTSADRFRVTSTRLPQGHYLIRNVADTIHFVDFEPVKPGTTNADITKVANAEMMGKPPASDPYLNKTGVQADVLSAGQQQVFSSPLLTPGTYDLECFIAEDMTGMPHFFMGMHKIIVIS